MPPALHLPALIKFKCGFALFEIKAENDPSLRLRLGGGSGINRSPLKGADTCVIPAPAPP